MMTFTTDEQDVPVILGIFNEVDRILLSKSCFQASNKKWHNIRLRRHSQDKGGWSWETSTEFHWKMTSY